jgi:CheY-like chemotaxis protein
LVGNRPPRLLLAEDNAVNQEVAVALIGSAGLPVDVAGDGQQAVEMVKAGDYALVLMDVQMPVMDGLDATRAIRRLPQGATLPILAMTANAFDDERQRCLDAGMDDHVAKPVVAEQLFATLYDWLSGARQVAPRPVEPR